MIYRVVGWLVVGLGDGRVNSEYYIQYEESHVSGREAR
jgi:hypothetical protein